VAPVSSAVGSSASAVFAYDSLSENVITLKREMFYEITGVFLNPSVSFVKTVLPYQSRRASLSQHSFAAGQSSTAVCQHISCSSLRSSADVSRYMQPRQPSPTACAFLHIFRPFGIVCCRYLAVTFVTCGYWPCYTDTGHVNMDTGHVIQILAILYRYWPYYADTGHVNTDTGHVNTDTGHVIQILAILYRYWPC